MTEYYFEKLNHHIIHIDTTEAEVRALWNEYLAGTTTPDFIMWCVFLSKHGIVFYFIQDVAYLEKVKNSVVKV